MVVFVFVVVVADLNDVYRFVDISDDNLNYAKSGALVDLICKEDGEKIFNCEYKIEPKQLCPIPTPTPKPTAKPKATAKPAVKK